jgi:glycogen operon protein
MDFYNGADNNGDGLKNIEWHGTNYKQPDWAPTSRVLAWRLDGSAVENKAPDDNDFYVMANHSHLELLFYLPPNRPGKRWYRVLDTGQWAENAGTLVGNIEQPGQEDVVSDGTWTNVTAATWQGNGSYTYKLGDKSMAVFIER